MQNCFLKRNKFRMMGVYFAFEYISSRLSSFGNLFLCVETAKELLKNNIPLSTDSA
jgi:hypothetical protein